VKSFKMLTHTRVKPAKCQKTNCVGFIQICSSPRFSWCFGGFSNEAARLLSRFVASIYAHCRHLFYRWTALEIPSIERCVSRGCESVVPSDGRVIHSKQFQRAQADRNGAEPKQ
jgi:hypothetical protein